MARGNAWVRIHEHEVQEFINPGGEVYDEIHKVAKNTRRASWGYINSRTGKLKGMIQVNRPSRTGAFELRALVFTRTSYAIYVHEGTAGNGAGYITPKHGRYLAVPRHRQGPGTGNPSGGTLRRMWKNSQARKYNKMGSKPYFTTEKIHGQKANPFLRKGMEDAMAVFRAGG